jgi:hypothetical protein
MGRKKQQWELLEEVLAVLECSPNLMPCKKFLHANIYRFADHMKNDRCKQCIAWFRQMDKELKSIRLLAEFKNRNIAESSGDSLTPTMIMSGSFFPSLWSSEGQSSGCSLTRWLH